MPAQPTATATRAGDTEPAPKSDAGPCPRHLAPSPPAGVVTTAREGGLLVDTEQAVFLRPAGLADSPQACL